MDSESILMGLWAAMAVMMNCGMMLTHVGVVHVRLKLRPLGYA